MDCPWTPHRTALCYTPPRLSVLPSELRTGGGSVTDHVLPAHPPVASYSEAAPLSSPTSQHWCRSKCSGAERAMSSTLSLWFTWCPHTQPSSLTPDAFPWDGNSHLCQASVMVYPTLGNLLKVGSCIVILFYRWGSWGMEKRAHFCKW